MAGNRQSRHEREKPDIIGMRNSPNKPAKEASVTRSQKPLVDGIIWPPFVTGSVTPLLVMQIQFEISQWWDPARILSYQLAQLRYVIAHAAKTTPFYRDRLAAVLAQSKKKLSLDVFRQIPILTRSEFQDAGDSINSTAVPASHGASHTHRTSGSTGEPLTLKGTQVTKMFNSAKNLRSHLWHRRDFSQKCLTFRTMKPGEPTKRSPAWGPAVDPGESVIVNTSQPVSDLLEIMKAEDPAYILLYPSVLKDLLRIAREQGYHPDNLRQVSTLGEILYPELREQCERQWNVQVTDGYSCEEFGSLALQCPEHPHYHIQSETTLIEVLRPDNTPCKPGEVGKTVISSLNNFATPMLRYENGDMAEVGEPCACGRGLPVLKRIIGRVHNMAVLPNGERVMPNTLPGTLLNDLPIKHFQLIQKTTEQIEARLVVGRRLTTAEEAALGDYFNKGFPHEFNFAFVYVDEIARGANGKYEVFRCEVPAE